MLVANVAMRPVADVSCRPGMVAEPEPNEDSEPRKPKDTERQKAVDVAPPREEFAGFCLQINRVEREAEKRKAAEKEAREAADRRIGGNEKVDRSHTPSHWPLHMIRIPEDQPLPIGLLVPLPRDTKATAFRCPATHQESARAASQDTCSAALTHVVMSSVLADIMRQLSDVKKLLVIDYGNCVSELTSTDVCRLLEPLEKSKSWAAILLSFCRDKRAKGIIQELRHATKFNALVFTDDRDNMMCGTLRSFYQRDSPPCYRFDSGKDRFLFELREGGYRGDIYFIDDRVKTLVAADNLRDPLLHVMRMSHGRAPMAEVPNLYFQRVGCVDDILTTLGLHRAVVGSTRFRFR